MIYFLALAQLLFYMQIPFVARFQVANGAPLVGQPVEMVLSVQLPAEAVITEWPELEREWELFTITAIGEQITQPGPDNSTIYEQRYLIRVWYPGEFSTPDVFITYVNNETTGTIQVEPAFFSVPSVLEGLSGLTLKPLKPQIWLPYLPPLVVAVGLMVVVGAGAAVGYYYRQQRPQPVIPPAVDQTPAQQALYELKRIYQQNKPPSEMVAQVSDCLRAYIQRQFGIPALDLTSDELLSQIDARNDQQLLSHREGLDRLLKQADLVKFAHYMPTEQGSRQYISAASTWIQEVDSPQV